MTGEELFQKLAAMTPEQRKLQICTRAEDVGRWRETVYNPCESIRVDDGSETICLVIY